MLRSARAIAAELNARGVATVIRVRGTGEMENLKIAFEPFIGDSVGSSSTTASTITTSPSRACLSIFLPTLFWARSAARSLADCLGSSGPGGSEWERSGSRRSLAGRDMAPDCWRQRRPSHGTTGVSASVSTLSASRHGHSTSATGTPSSRLRRTIRQALPREAADLGRRREGEGALATRAWGAVANGA